MCTMWVITSATRYVSTGSNYRAPPAHDATVPIASQLFKQDKTPVDFSDRRNLDEQVISKWKGSKLC